MEQFVNVVVPALDQNDPKTHRNCLYEIQTSKMQLNFGQYNQELVSVKCTVSITAIKLL